MNSLLSMFYSLNSVVSEETWVHEWPQVVLQSGSRVMLNDRVVGISNKLGLSSAYKSELGLYACEKVSKLKSKSANPFKIDTLAVYKISSVLRKQVEACGFLFSGWYLYNSGIGYYVLSCMTHIKNDSSFCINKGSVGCIKYYISASTIVSCKDSFCEEDLKVIGANLAKVVKSLHFTGLDVDLLDVSYSSGFDSARRASSKISLSGISVISDRNGFAKFPSLKGKIAIAIVPK